MKNLLCLFCMLCVLSSCKKDNQSYVLNDPNSLDGATVAKTGSLTFFDDSSSEGLAKIYIRKDGVTVFGLEQMNYESAYSDVDVYMSVTPALTTASVKIFSAKKMHGNIYYPLNNGINAFAFGYVIIQGDTDDSSIASAVLK
ncbi:MAG: hypothetical protein QM726_19185 [Chitinophagaceae bacterium]